MGLLTMHQILPVIYSSNHHMPGSRLRKRTKATPLRIKSPSQIDGCNQGKRAKMAP